MPGCADLPVAILGISHMGCIERSRYGVLIAWDNDKMNVIGHYAVCEYGEVVFLAVLPYPIKILPPVIIVAEYVLSVIATLCYMMGQTRGYDAGKSWHELMLLRRG
jgi:hypothetical protein